MARYFKRYIENIIKRKLLSSGAVFVVGPKFCGKTTTCMNFSKSVFRLNTKSNIENAKINPKLALTGEIPHLIDEWQTVPDIWNYIKEDLDIDYVFGKYILTGSSTPVDKSRILHSGAGRITPIKMYPMSLYESKNSSGIVELSKLFRDKDLKIVDSNQNVTLEDIAFYICRGGWPLSILVDKEIALDITNNYYNGLFLFEESSNMLFRNKKPEIFRMILKSYARNISTEASKKTIINDVRQNQERTLDEKTFDNYIEALRDLYIIEDVPAWSPELRSKTSIISTPTRHFVDPSIACQTLGIYPNDLLGDFKTFGLFFEDLAIRDLRIYSSLIGGTISHYRDNAGLECDAIIHLPNGDWAAVEIKLGGEELIDYGAKKLKLIKKKISEKSSIKEPIFMMILTAIGPLYKRADGIFVVPISTLKA